MLTEVLWPLSLLPPSSSSSWSLSAVLPSRTKIVLSTIAFVTPLAWERICVIDWCDKLLPTYSDRLPCCGTSGCNETK